MRQVKSRREYFYRIFKRFYAVSDEFVVLKPCGIRLPCAYPKNVQENLTEEQKQSIKALVDAIKKE